MPKYYLYGDSVIAIRICVEADSLEKAIEKAEEFNEYDVMERFDDGNFTWDGN